MQITVTDHTTLLDPYRMRSSIRNISNRYNRERCLHRNCPSCSGSGMKSDGTACIHMLSCNCPLCSPRC